MENPAETTLEMSEFQVVNKKKKSRKQRRPGDSTGVASAAVSGGPAGDGEDVHPSSNASNRRKSSCSMPVSDKSDSSDLDSVHSLPVSAKLGNVPVATYADMASPPTPFLNSVEHFPELCRPVTNSPQEQANVCVNASANADPKRPPVIIPVSREPIEVSGLTFGFELNEQLLALGNEAPPTPTPTPTPPQPNECHVPTHANAHMADSFTARYLAPVVLNNYNHDKIVSYVGQGESRLLVQAANSND